MGKGIENKFREGDWIHIELTVEPESYLRLDESNVNYYNKLREEAIGGGPKRVRESEVRKYYENKIKEHTEEVRLNKMFAEVYRYKLLDVENGE